MGNFIFKPHKNFHNLEPWILNLKLMMFKFVTFEHLSLHRNVTVLYYYQTQALFRLNRISWIIFYCNCSNAPFHSGELKLLLNWALYVLTAYCYSGQLSCDSAFLKSVERFTLLICKNAFSEFLNWPSMPVK